MYFLKTLFAISGKLSVRLLGSRRGIPLGIVQKSEWDSRNSRPIKAHSNTVLFFSRISSVALARGEKKEMTQVFIVCCCGGFMLQQLPFL